MTRKSIASLLLGFALVVIIFTGCSETGTNPPATKKVKILSFSPLRGFVGTVVTITGENFSAEKAKNIVSFAGRAATVDSVYPQQSPTKIICRVPQSAVTGRIIVSVDTYSDTSQTDFIIYSDKFPETIGSYWIEEKHLLDSLNQPVADLAETDSLAITAKPTILGKPAIAISEFFYGFDQYHKTTENNYYYDDKKVYARSSFINNIMKIGGIGSVLPFQIPDQWLLIGDPNGSTWDIYQKTFNNDTIKYGSITLLISGILTLKGAVTGEEQFDILRKLGKIIDTLQSDQVQVTVTAKKYTLVFAFDCIVNIGADIPVKINRYLHLWYAPGVGRVKMELETLNFNIPPLQPDVIEGFTTKVTRYYIAE